MVESALSIVPGDFTDSRVLALLKEHLDGLHGSSPPGSVYALGAAALQARDVSFYTAWRGAQLLGCAALEPALRLYRRYGFQNCAVFGDYRASDFNQFLELELHR
ncbi:MAG TPA: hypothetical protein VEQ58_05570 [Polyangiaceae bacterium]|nr:hypothetical protein [Polyangiaceae bacterium]